MKKMTRPLALILALTMLSTVAVGAAATDTGAQGVYDIVCDSGYTLTPLTAAGGSIGVWAAMYAVRHKTLHMKFVIGVPLILAVQIGLILYFLLR